ncbi:MAG: flagellin [Planctomycetota bacterium]
MSMRINSNVQAVNGYNHLSRNDHALGKSLERLSSGLRINSSGDDPAGLVISQQLRAQLTGLQRAVANTESGVNLTQTAEGAMDEISTLLKKVRELSLAAANASVNDNSQLQADQSELDNAIRSITRIAQTTQFGTKKLLDGSLAAANNYDTTKIYRFDVGSALLTHVSYVPGAVSLVMDSSAETNTVFTYSAAEVDVTSAGGLVELQSALTAGATSWGDFLLGIGTLSTTTSKIVQVRVSDTTHSIVADTAADTAAEIYVSLNARQSTYSFDLTGGLFTATRLDTGALGALRDLSIDVFSGDGTGLATFEGNTSLGVSYGHNIATTIKTSGVDTFSGFSVAGGSLGESATVFVGGNGVPLAGSTMREVFAIGTNRLNNGAAMNITVAGREFAFSSNESIGDMISYINSVQQDYEIGTDLDHGLILVKNKLGSGGASTDLTIRVRDGLERQSFMPTLAVPEVEFSGAGPLTAGGGIDFGVDVLAHLAGTGLPSLQIDLTTQANDASVLRNDVFGIVISTDNLFVRQAQSTTANLAKGALFQIGANNGQQIGLDIKSLTASMLGLNGDSTGTLVSLQSLIDSQSLVNGLFTQSLDVIDQAIDDVITQRGYLGAFESNTLETNLSSLGGALQNLTAAESTIRDADFAKESATFARNQILRDASTSMLAQANQISQSVLELIRGQ